MARKKGELAGRGQKTVMTAELQSAFPGVIVKVPIATEAGWGYDAAVTASQASFSNVIGEPGHTKHAPPGQALAKALWFVLGVLLSTLIEGLSIPRKTGTLTFQAWCLQPLQCWNR